jgi:hypothetical protein
MSGEQRRRAKIGPEDLLVIHRLFNDGRTNAEIASAIGAGRRTIREHCAKLGLSRGRGAFSTGRKRWAGRIPIPPHAHPLVRQMFEIINADRLTIAEATSGAGPAPYTVSRWRYDHNPSIQDFEAVLNRMGYELAIRQKGDE